MITEQNTGQPDPAAGFINEDELAKRIPLSKKTLKRHRDAGKLPYVQLGGRIFYHWPSVEAALLRQQRIVAV